MGKIIVPIEIETEGMLEDALEIKRLADELGRNAVKTRDIYAAGKVYGEWESFLCSLAERPGKQL